MVGAAIHIPHYVRTLFSHFQATHSSVAKMMCIDADADYGFGTFFKQNTVAVEWKEIFESNCIFFSPKLPRQTFLSSQYCVENEVKLVFNKNAT